MDTQTQIDRLMDSPGNRTKIDAARILAPFTEDSRVMDALCEAAVNTTSRKVRDVLIEVLRANPAGAGIRFSDYALWSSIPSQRASALMNLSLLECREAMDAVLRGLGDPDASVRMAAAMNAGLFDDISVLDALERYFESNRFGLTLSFIKSGLRMMKNTRQRIDQEDLIGAILDRS